MWEICEFCAVVLWQSWEDSDYLRARQWLICAPWDLAFDWTLWSISFCHNRHFHTVAVLSFCQGSIETLWLFGCPVTLSSKGLSEMFVSREWMSCPGSSPHNQRAKAMAKNSPVLEAMGIPELVLTSFQTLREYIHVLFSQGNSPCHLLQCHMSAEYLVSWLISIPQTLILKINDQRCHLNLNYNDLCWSNFVCIFYTIVVLVIIIIVVIITNCSINFYVFVCCRLEIKSSCWCSL